MGKKIGKGILDLASKDKKYYELITNDFEKFLNFLISNPTDCIDVVIEYKNEKEQTIWFAIKDLEYLFRSHVNSYFYSKLKNVEPKKKFEILRGFNVFGDKERYLRFRKQAYSTKNELFINIEGLFLMIDGGAFDPSPFTTKNPKGYKSKEEYENEFQKFESLKNFILKYKKSNVVYDKFFSKNNKWTDHLRILY